MRCNEGTNPAKLRANERHRRMGYKSVQAEGKEFFKRKKRDVVRSNKEKKNRLGQLKKGEKNLKYGVSW
jgi:hypothetical protein